jgi:2-dehydro-3-deoxyphosphogluconate aldolase/(4S)-4-hydroxy-2-oxoglutarate aldolase
MFEIRWPLIPVVVLDDPAAAEPLADALVAGGLPVAEITLRTPAGIEAIRRLAGRTDILVGAGTVVNARQLDEAVDAGAQFAVSPGSSPALLDRAAELGAWLIPGAATASEVQQVFERGIDLIKFFPASTSGGSAAIKALSGPFPGVSFVPTGGIGPANLAEFLGLTSVSCVGGSWMAPRKAIAAGDFAAVERLTTEAMALASRIVEGREAA